MSRIAIALVGRAVCGVLLLTLTAGLAAARDVPEESSDSTPDWASGFPLWGELFRVHQKPTDLGNMSLRGWPFNLVAVDANQNMYLLNMPDPGVIGSEARIIEFSADGERQRAWRIPLGSIDLSFPKAFAVNPDGDTFAVVDGNQLFLFDRDRQLRAFDFPHMAVDVVFNKGNLQVSQVPPSVIDDLAEAANATDEERYLIVDLDDRGRITSGMLEPEPMDAPRPHLATFIQRVWVAHEPDTNRIWAADVMRYRLRRLSPSGRALTTIEHPELDADMGFDVTHDEMPTDLVRQTGQTIINLRGRPVIWDLQVFDDLLYVLISAEVVSSRPVLDIYDLNGLPIVRFEISLGTNLNGMAVTDDSIWFFWSFTGQRPIRTSRIPTGELISIAGDARAQGEEPIQLTTNALSAAKPDQGTAGNTE